jgi:hypothetical protein
MKKLLLTILLFTSSTLYGTLYYENVNDDLTSYNNLSTLRIDKGMFLLHITFEDGSKGVYAGTINIINEEEAKFDLHVRMVVNGKEYIETDFHFTLKETGFVVTVSDKKGTSHKFIQIIPPEEYIDNMKEDK